MSDNESNIKCDPLISVIMPLHNESPQVFETAVMSVLNQTWQDFEIIICDDGCEADNGSDPDNGLEPDNGSELDKASEPDNGSEPAGRYDIFKSEVLKNRIDSSRIRIVKNQRTKGASGARNTAISFARGKYIALMDADDYSAPERLEKELLFLNQHGEYGFVGCRAFLFDIDPGDSFGEYWYVSRPEAEDFLMTLPFVHASILFRKSALMKVHCYREGKQVLRSEDYDLLMRMYAEGIKGANIPDALYYVRTDSNTIRRRKYRYRIPETIVKAQGFYRMGLMPKGFIFAVKPMVVGLIPNKILTPVKKRFYKDKEM